MENKIFYLPKFQDSGKLPSEKKSKRWKNILGTILDFTPIVGDVKGYRFLH